MGFICAAAGAKFTECLVFIIDTPCHSLSFSLLSLSLSERPYTRGHGRGEMEWRDEAIGMRNALWVVCLFIYLFIRSFYLFIYFRFLIPSRWHGCVSPLSRTAVNLNSVCRIRYSWPSRKRSPSWRWSQVRQSSSHLQLWRKMGAAGSSERPHCQNPNEGRRK